MTENTIDVEMDDHRTQRTQAQHTTEAALVSPNSFYKSKLSNIHHGVNPLATACAPLFSIINQCQQLTPDSDLETLARELIHEIHAFECNAQQHTYQEKTILATRFALCAFIDERIEFQLGEHKTAWQPHLMLQRFHGTKDGGDQFYILLERSSIDSAGYIDLLEIFYLCLALGYQGKYSTLDHGFIIRENKVNKLYQTIRQQRGDFSKNVLIGDGNQADPTPNTTPIKQVHKGVIAISMFAIFVVFLIIANQYSAMQQTDESMQQTISHLLDPNTQTNDTPPQVR